MVKLNLSLVMIFLEFAARVVGLHVTRHPPSTVLFRNASVPVRVLAAVPSTREDCARLGRGDRQARFPRVTPLVLTSNSHAPA